MKNYLQCQKNNIIINKEKYQWFCFFESKVCKPDKNEKLYKLWGDRKKVFQTVNFLNSISSIIELNKREKNCARSITFILILLKFWSYPRQLKGKNLFPQTNFCMKKFRIPRYKISKMVFLIPGNDQWDFSIGEKHFQFSCWDFFLLSA